MPVANRSPAHYLCAAVIVKREAAAMGEWLAFHRLVGVDHVAVYDHESGDDERPTLASVLAPYAARGATTLHPWPPANASFPDCPPRALPRYDRALGPRPFRLGR